MIGLIFELIITVVFVSIVLCWVRRCQTGKKNVTMKNGKPVYKPLGVPVLDMLANIGDKIVDTCQQTPDRKAKHIAARRPLVKDTLNNMKKP